jgi:hypothetical protein
VRPSLLSSGSTVPRVSADLRAGTITRSSERKNMGIIAFIILGLLAGAIAKAIMPGDDPGG